MEENPYLRAFIAFLLITAVVLPGAASARSQGEKVVLAPIVLPSRNSQTIELLEGYTNTNPTGVGGSILAVVDNSALESVGEESGAFVDTGVSGTGQISTYVVRKGDTLSGIADMFGVSVNTIIWANDIKNNTIKEGQELVILPITGVRHVVKSGESLKSIVTKYKADLEDILAYNNLDSTSKIKAGDIIIVPGGAISGSITSPTKSSGSKISSGPTLSIGALVRPIAGGKKSQGIHGYNGVDLAAPVGTPIVASMAGKVIVSRTGGYNGGYGTYVVISHAGGVQTVYGHMKDNYVSVGQNVEQGEVIGSIGMTGHTTGPHIHFEVRGAKNPF
jgi:murein DD-endopeptidase MepM/ murein hydrolase activator NlpD